MIAKFVIVIFVIVAPFSYGAIPTIEGLFRNPSNSDVSSSNAILKLKIEPNDSEAKPLYVKYFLNNELKSRVRLLQAVYNSSDFSNDSLIDVRYVDNTGSTKVLREKRLFYAILSSLLLNRSEELSRYTKEISKDFKTNSESINYEKRNLILSYKNYLKEKKDNKDIDPALNPLKASDEDKKEKIKRIMSSSYYMHNGLVSLEKVDGEFMWLASLEHFKGHFLNESMQMKKLEFDNLSSLDTVSFDQYLLYDGVHEFPKKIKITFAGSLYQLSTMSLRHIESTSKSISSRYSDYRKKLSKSAAVADGANHPLL